MLEVILYFITAALAGTSVLAALGLGREKVLSVLLGTIGGVVVLTMLGYGLSLLFLPLHAVTIGLIIIAAVTTVLLLGTTNAWQNWRVLPFDWVAAVSFLLLFVVFSIIAPKLLITTPDGLSTGIINAYGDVAWHTANITMFAEGQSLPPENPIFADTRLQYPFLISFLSALFLASGTTLPISITWPAVALIPTLIVLLYSLTRELTDRKTAGVITLLLFLFGGATLGFLRLPADWQTSEESLGSFLLNLPDRDYSGVGTDGDGYHFLNPVTTLLLPQRSFLFGISLAAAIILLLWQGRQEPSKRRAAYIVAGVLAAMLPLAHAHTILALLPIIILLFLLNPSWQWIWFVAPALLIGSPGIAYHVTGTTDAQPGAFFRWGPGWMVGERNVVWYWIKNTGLLIPLTLVGFFLPAPRHLKFLSFAALLIFLAANLWLFAPWAWDNFKLFVYFFIFSLPLVSYLASQALKRSYLWGAATFVLIAVHVLSASLDLWKLALPTATEWQEWDAAALEIADEIKEKTQAGESVLTAPIHNSAAVLAGRPLYLGYAAHVWSHGGDPWQREKAIEQFYNGTITSLPETTPDYVLVGPSERAKYPNLVIKPAWQLVTQTDEYQLYRPNPNSQLGF